MSTSLSLVLDESTIDAEHDNESNTYFYGEKGTGGTPQVVSETQVEKYSARIIKPRSPRERGVDSHKNILKEDVKQVWNGTVIDCNDGELTARIEDITNPDNPEELITLSIEEIESRDRELVKAGAMFLWHIGYRYGPKYPRERFSKIRFRRLPLWTEEEIQDAKILSKEYADFFLADSKQSS